MNPIESTIRENVPLAPMTTLRLGGPARRYVEVSDEGDLRAALQWARDNNMKFLLLGGGSNMLVSDAGFDGLVIRIAIGGVSYERVDDRVLVIAGAGVDWDDLVAETVDRDFAGFECLSGIPGCVGATPIQNVGAYGQEVSETLVEVRAIDVETLEPVRFTNEECGFGYRDSRFKGRDKGRFAITSVSYALVAGGDPAIRYPELEREAGESPTLRDVRSTVLRIRGRKGMVVDPADPDSVSAGSFFTNPILSPEDYAKFVERARAVVGDEAGIPAFPGDDGSVKLSAAWLIDHAGFEKGTRYRDVGLSSKHVLAIVNRGEGTAAQVRELAGRIQEKVEQTFGVPLVPEPNFIGFD